MTSSVSTALDQFEWLKKQTCGQHIFSLESDSFFSQSAGADGSHAGTFGLEQLSTAKIVLKKTGLLKDTLRLNL